MNWRLLPTISAPMPLQMALDETLFLAHKQIPQEAHLRFYVSQGPWISVGYSFCGDEELSKSELVRQSPGVPLCRRVTGGGCVLHGDDLIFALVARYAGTGTIFQDQKWSQSPLSSVKVSYAKIHEAVRLGLQTCGLDPRFYQAGELLPKGSDCFDFPVESDLSWKGVKIAGGAQKRSEGVLLHHESIRIPQGVERTALIQAILRGMETVFGVTIASADLDPEVYFQAEKKNKTPAGGLPTAVSKL